jgi:hypothetical protein
LTLALIVPPVNVAAADEPCRAGQALYHMPAGWERKPGTSDGVVHLALTNAPAGQWMEIRIPKEEALAGSLRQQLQAEVDAVKAKFTDAEQTPIIQQHHRRGYDYALTTVSMRAAPNSNEFIYCLVYLAQTGDTAQPIYAMTNNPDLYNRNKASLDAFLTDLNFTSLTKLADGNPPLTQATVDQVVDFLEWLMEVPFTDAQKDTAREELIKTWRRGDKTEIQGILDVLKAGKDLSAMPAQKREAVREGVLEQALKQWRKDQATDPDAKLLVDIYDAAHKPIAQADPPLTRHQADATIELLYFMGSQVDGIQPIQPAPGVKDKWADALASNYAKMKPDQREQIQKAPFVWATLRMVWPELPQDQKDQMKRDWAQLPQVTAIAANLKTLTAQSASSDDPRKIAEMMRKTQETANYYAAISQANRMIYETNRAIIMNMNGGYHYEYRYR